MAIRIERVDPGSEAEALGLGPGDELLSVDDNELNDTLDYDFYTDSASFHLKAKVADGIREWDVTRLERGPFGCDFKTYLGDAKHSCSNHCMFCFIDQLPPGMRESLYFKDDDERLSFLFGNYITMTNMQDHEIDRIIKMHISPINISVHTTNPQLRIRMLANKRGGEVLKYLPRLVEGGIAINCQLVLCRGINDGDELRRTLTDLLELTPMVQSVAAVERSRVALILVDATVGFTEQDSKVAGYAHDQGKACIIVVNKWDAVEGKETNTMELQRRDYAECFSFMGYAPIIFISAQTGYNVNKLMQLIRDVDSQNGARVPTGVLNEMLARATARMQPPSDKGRRLKIFYLTQASTRPPTFVAFVNSKQLFHFSYQRYLINQIRENFGLEHTPIRLVIRERGSGEVGAKDV